jgi:hypothetical protein
MYTTHTKVICNLSHCPTIVCITVASESVFCALLLAEKKKDVSALLDVVPADVAISVRIAFSGNYGERTEKGC